MFLRVVEPYLRSKRKLQDFNEKKGHNSYETQTLSICCWNWDFSWHNTNVKYIYYTKRDSATNIKNNNTILNVAKIWYYFCRSRILSPFFTREYLQHFYLYIWATAVSNWVFFLFLFTSMEAIALDVLNEQ